MKVAIICDYWKNSRGGGIKIYLTNLVEHLETKNIKVNVLFREGNDFKNIKIKGPIFFSVIKSVVELTKIKPDVVHTHEKWHFLLIGRIYKLFFDCRLIHTFHTEPSRETPKIKKKFFKFLTEEYDSITFVSNDLVRKIYTFKGIKSKEPVITYAGVESIDVKNVSEEEIKKFRELYNIKNDAIVLLGSGLTATKLKAEGAKMLIKAIVNLKVFYPNIMLLLTRDDYYTDELRNFAKSQNVLENVVFTGDIENPFLPLTICDVYTHTPLIEGGVSLALLEAMSVGKPIVATSVGGIPEAIEDGVSGFLVNTNEELIQKIDLLLKNKDFATKMGSNAKKISKEKFTWEETTEKFIKLYSIT